MLCKSALAAPHPDPGTGRRKDRPGVSGDVCSWHSCSWEKASNEPGATEVNGSLSLSAGFYTAAPHGEHQSLTSACTMY